VKTLSYPNYTDYIQPKPMRDLSKWMNTMRDIYVKTHLGANKKSVIDSLTNSWDKMERVDFIDWMKYYESGDFNKYKKAQYYVNDAINYFVPNPANKPPSPILDMDKFPGDQQIIPQPHKPYEMSPEERKKAAEEAHRKLVEDQRRKILGRLNSAEKLLSSHQGQIFAGPDFEKLLNAIYELKKQIQTVNKISLSTQTCIDLIIRQANILNNQGCNDAAMFMVKLAQQTPGNFDFNFGETPAGGSQPQGQGSLGNNNPTAKDLMTPPPGTQPEASPGSEGNGIDEFLRNLKGGGFTDFDDNSVKDEVDMGEDDVLLDQEIIPNDTNNLVVEAQMMPTDMQQPKREQKPRPRQPEMRQPKVDPKSQDDLTVDKVKRGPDVSQVKNDFDALIDTAFNNLTVNDVIDKLEDINKIFRNREISRQLAIADVMLDRLGLASYFPGLAEATNKSLDSNMYCLTRIEDILSRLRGGVKGHDIDLTNEDHKKRSPELETLQNNLGNQQKKEQERKQLRKQVEDEKDIEKAVKPDGAVENVPQDLIKEPIQVEKPKVPAPARPSTAPIR
jgi:hypothetical protein